MEQRDALGIKWLDWTDDAFQRAVKEDKPVLLDISAVWCHWCHRLDQDTYSVPDISEYINTHFVPIRVDTDKRPDINRRYNMGGWPTTAFLTPDGRVIGGGTYMPPDQMRQVLRDVQSFWEKAHGKPAQEIQMPEPESIPVGSLSMSIVDDVLGEIANNFDPIYGGFGSQPKFPNTEAHELALLKYHYSGNREFLKIVALTLQTAGRSGVYDKEVGGFFRYSTTRDWGIPHFEKMCEDNAKWLRVYVHTYQVTGEPFYAEIARGIIEYVDNWLSDQKEGCFYGSQDADEGYYSKSKAERLNLTPPFVDKNIYTNWNSLMISAYLNASFVLGDSSIRDFALKSLGRLLNLNYKPDQGMYHFYDGSPRLPNQLADQTQTANALCDAYEATGEMRFLEMAEEVTRIATSKLFDQEHGGFFDMVAQPNAPGFLSKPSKPLDENSLAAHLLIRLHRLTAKENYRILAEESLKRFAEIYPQFGFMAADYAMAVDDLMNQATMIRIVGSPERSQTKGMLAEANRIYDPRKTIRILDPATDRAIIADLGYQIGDSPAAYICVGTICAAPVSEPRQIALEVNRMITSSVSS